MVTSVSAFFHQTSESSAARRGITFVVRHQTNRRALACTLQQFHHRVAILRIKIPRWLVCSRMEGDRPTPRHGNALLLPAGKLRRIMLRTRRHPDFRQRLSTRSRVRAVSRDRSMAVQRLPNRQVAMRLKLWKMNRSRGFARGRASRNRDARRFAAQFVFAARRRISRRGSRAAWIPTARRAGDDT